MNRKMLVSWQVKVFWSQRHGWDYEKFPITKKTKAQQLRGS